jgi:hypothetical protein
MATLKAPPTARAPEDATATAKATMATETAAKMAETINRVARLSLWPKL